MADSVVKLKIDDKEYNASLRSAKQGLAALEQSMQQAGKSFVDVDKKVVDYVRELGKMNTQAVTSKGKISEMTAAFTEYGMVYKRMTDQEKASPVGKAMAQSLDQLKTRIVQAKADLVDLNKQLLENESVTEMASDESTNFGSVLQSLGSQLGINTNLLSGLTTGVGATAAAVAAGAVAVGLATKAWADYNNELNRQNTITSVVTAGKGGEELTVGVRALAKTYDVDFRQAIEAANTLMQQFGVTSTEALRLLQDGMQGMIAGDGGKLLAMIQQYAPSFRDAGIEASQLVAIIQNSEGGIFTDQNMNAIVMGIRNIRLMTEQTQKSLELLGIDGAEMTRKLNDGTMTIFEAMQQVSKAIEDAGTSSQAVGQVMQQVFGRQGTAAGTNLAKAIETLNTNLEETKTQTGELGESFVKLNEANERLESTMQDIFGMTGWEDMNNLLKTDLANTLSDVLDYMNDIKTAITGIGTADGFEALCDVLDGMVIPKLMGVTTAMRNIKAFMDGFTGGGGGGTLSGIGKGIGASFDRAMSSVKGSQSKGFSITTDSNGKVIKATRDGKDITSDYLNNKKSNTNPPPPKTTTNTTPKGGSKVTPWAPIAMGEFTGIDITGRSVNDVTKDIQQAQAKFNEAGDEMGRSMAKAMIDALQKEKDTIMNEGDVTKGGFADAYNHDFGKDIARLEKDRIRNDNENKATTEKTMVGELQKITGGVEGMLSGLNQLGVDIPEGLNNVVRGLSGMLSVLQSINMIVGTIQTIQTVGTFLGIFGHGGIVGKAANGMVVPGNSFSGDNLRMPVVGGGMIGVNSGEVILNESQSGNLVNKLFSQQNGEVDVQPWVDGEKVYLGMNNTLQRKGKGEIVTTSMLRQKGIL